MISAQGTTSMIDWATDGASGITMWRNSGAIFTLDYALVDGVRNNLLVAHHGNFVTIKSESSPHLNIITVCSNVENYNPDTHLCIPCNNSYKSWGFQQPDCLPCSTMRNYGRSNTIEMAYYDQICMYSEINTGWVLLMTILGLAVAAFVCASMP